MPKEITHWSLARIAAKALGEGRARKAMEANPNLYLIGAITPDTPYYALFGVKGIFTPVGDNVHSVNGGNSFEHVGRILAAKPSGADENLALALGISTHILADAVFHPMVYYFTGDYADPDPERRKKAVARHRRLESLMDIYYVNKLTPPLDGLLKNMVNAKEAADSNVGRMLSRYFFGAESNAAQALEALSHHSWIQRSFFSQAVSTLIGAAGVFGGLDEYKALFYPPKGSATHEFFLTPISYLHPVTGDRDEVTMDQLEQRFVNKVLDFFSGVETALSDGTIMDFMAHTRGPSLETGMAETVRPPFKHFADPSIMAMFDI
ncbi:MAG: zinc dependent phospholipase C family protein [Nitrospinae bacterium]|nr:zinc dependent phospholipase C family protein [Nitrospinota bacterium]